MNLVKSEIKKTFREALCYYPDYIVGLITDFLLLLIVLGTEGNITEKVLGYLLWVLANGVLSEASMCISTEKQLGTLQNLLIKPYSIISIITVKTLVWFIINLIKGLLILGIVAFVFGAPNLFKIDYLYVFFLVCIGIMGFSYILAALTLMFTKVASFVSIIGYLFLFLSGSIVAIPDFFVFTNPLSYGAKYIQLIIDKNNTLNSFLILIVICGTWFLLGLLIVKATFSHSKQFKWSY